jgi:hypothetical protein
LWGEEAGNQLASFRSSRVPEYEYGGIGFRVALVPEPSTFVLALTALLATLGIARARRSRTLGSRDVRIW